MSPSFHHIIARGAVVLTALCVFATVVAAQSIELSVLGTYKTGVYNASSAEIVAHDPSAQRLFIVRGDSPLMDIIDITNPSAPVFISNINIGGLWSQFGGANSVAVRDGIVAVAAQASPKTDPGRVYFFDVFGTYINHVVVGALPDMLTFNEDGSKILVANEGEPNDSYTIDPEGSVSIIDLSQGVTMATVATAGFAVWNPSIASLRAAGVRIYGPNATVAQDIEPEYITVKGNLAWVSLQENNALAIIDIANATVLDIVPLGLKDHSLPSNGLDASDQDGSTINIATWPVKGMYQPDAIASVAIDGETYIVTANEGDARDYPAFSEEARMRSVSQTLIDPLFPNLSSLRANNQLGRLNISTATGDTNGDGKLDELHVFGARSFSIRSAAGTLLWDSGDQFERITAATYPAYFNFSNTDNTFDSRSDNKGPEPEALAVATICGRTYAFIGLERIGGVMVYDISNPTAPVFEQYINNRNFTQTPGAVTVNTIGDLGPEGLIHIDAADSPNGEHLLVCASEVSGTVTLFSVRNTSVPQLTAALTLVNRINASKGDFRVDIEATDGCDPAPAVRAVMSIPSLNNPTVTFSVESRPKVKFHPVQNSVSVEAPDPQQFWADILAQGGVTVVDGTVFEFDRVANYPKVDFEFNTDGTLRKIKAPFAQLSVAATDVSNNTVNALATADFSTPKRATGPATASLEQNYPNPFNPGTTIRFSLAEGGRTTLHVHDVLGRSIAVLVDGILLSGDHVVNWNGRDDHGRDVPAGLYLYTLRTAEALETRRMTLVK